MNPRVATALSGWLITGALIGLSFLTTDETPLDTGVKLLGMILGAFTLALSFLAAADITSGWVAGPEDEGE